MATLAERFEAVNEHYGKFEEVNSKHSLRQDLHAFIALDRLFPNGKNIITASAHDVIYLNIDIEHFSDHVRDETILELVRCGVRYDAHHDCLAMYV